eukprot:Pgem_evm1s12082
MSKVNKDSILTETGKVAVRVLVYLVEMYSKEVEKLQKQYHCGMVLKASYARFLVAVCNNMEIIKQEVTHLR